MSKFIDENTVAEIKQRADLVDTVGQFVTLKQAGANFKGNCPRCDSSSFTVTPPKDMFKCFGCGWGGKGAISFLMGDKRGSSGLSYPEALKWIADRNGITID